MADLVTGGMSGHARAENNGHPRPGTTGSPQIRGPRDIMRERNAREARRRAEQEALEKSRAEEDARLLEEDRRRQAERRAAAGAAANRLDGGGMGNEPQQRIDRRQGDRAASSGEIAKPIDQPQRRNTTARTQVPEVAPLRLPTQQPAKSEAEPDRSGQAQTGATANRTTPGQPAPLSIPARETTRSSFPHAFERWETLSAHWEGLTNFWIRRLEENSVEISRDPVSVQLARQNTDLSAAGANLFHAVVELQRLRASSERKFQRWFFDTRAETERLSETNGQLEQQLKDERASRQLAINEAVLAEQAKVSNDKVNAELKRELQIARDEARRAWEELGRREQEERERTAALREGQAIFVGGVQVVPMVQGVPTRHGSSAVRDVPPTRQGPTDGRSQNVQEPDSPSQDSDATYQDYSRNQRADPSDPFVDNPRDRRGAGNSAYTQAPAVQPASPPRTAHQGQGRPLHPSTQAGQAEGPEYSGGMSEEEYEIDSQGQYVRDAAGNRVPYTPVDSDNETEEYEISPRRYRETGRRGAQPTQTPMSGVEYGQGPTMTAPPTQSTSPSPAPVDYSGTGYGGGAVPGWEAFPRHHHPTRLSDVLEEDERSRTSASLVSGRL
ncbi:reticulocyte-binding 2 a protein [Rutstroemia sp. NJR-2017a WRK4]|nr:reticulocyte-binding 2 a protein [Rutstroemia sp. NJR-2017a WRK4]